MYEILLDGETLYHPNSDTKIITSAVIKEALNEAGCIDISVPCLNPLWGVIHEYTSKIEVLKDDVAIWRGYVQDIDLDFAKNKVLYVSGELSYLNQTVQRQHKYEGTRISLLSQILAVHNAVSTEKFNAGYFSQNGNKHISFVTDWEYTLESVRKYLCDDEEYVRIRYENGIRYIDILGIADYGKRSEQYISLGENLIDYAQESVGDNIVSGCIPLGVTLDDGGIEGYDNYLTCEAANDGQITVWNAETVSRFGYITKVVHFNVLDTPEALKTAAINYLSNTQFAKMTLELTAFDLSNIDSDIDNFSVGDYVRAVCPSFGMDAWMPVREKTTNLLRLADNKISIGAEGTKSFTAIQSESIADVKEFIPVKSEVLSQAMRNASNMINANGDNGHVVLKTNNDGVVSEILIMDTADIDTATKMWRFNEGGLGFRSRENIGSEWKDYDIALTMDGQILAKHGVIGSDDSAWSIGAHSIYNGTSNIEDIHTDGLYVGTDGILSAGEGLFGARVYTKISGGKVISNTTIEASSIKGNAITGGTINAENGQSTAVGFIGNYNNQQCSIGLGFTNGILTSFFAMPV